MTGPVKKAQATIRPSRNKTMAGGRAVRPVTDGCIFGRLPIKNADDEKSRIFLLSIVLFVDPLHSSTDG